MDTSVVLHNFIIISLPILPHHHVPHPRSPSPPQALRRRRRRAHPGDPGEASRLREEDGQGRCHRRRWPQRGLHPHHPRETGGDGVGGRLPQRDDRHPAGMRPPTGPGILAHGDRPHRFRNRDVPGRAAAERKGKNDRKGCGAEGCRPQIGRRRMHHHHPPRREARTPSGLEHRRAFPGTGGADPLPRHGGRGFGAHRRQQHRDEGSRRGGQLRGAGACRLTSNTL